MLAGGRLAAQRVQVTGQILYGPTKGPLAGARVVLHAVRQQGRESRADSTLAGPDGRFSLAIARVDTAAFYVVTSWYRGIAYFSEPVPVTSPTAALHPILVYDTSSTGPPIRLARRVVSVARPKVDGTRSVLEFLELRNPGRATRITNDTLHPVWAGALPHGAIQFDLGQGDFGGDAVGVRGDSVVVVGPIPPGDLKELSYSYSLLATVQRLVLPLDQVTEELDVLVEDTTTAIRGPGLENGGVKAVDERRFASYRAREVPPGTSIEFDFPNPPLRVQSLVPYVIALAALALALGLWVALRRPARSLAPRRRKG